MMLISGPQFEQGSTGNLSVCMYVCVCVCVCVLAAQHLNLLSEHKEFTNIFLEGTWSQALTMKAEGRCQILILPDCFAAWI